MFLIPQGHPIHHSFQGLLLVAVTIRHVMN
jgi:hypothetical protein